jgi:hypothetical protein
MRPFLFEFDVTDRAAPPIRKLKPKFESLKSPSPRARGLRGDARPLFRRADNIPSDIPSAAPVAAPVADARAAAA